MFRNTLDRARTERLEKRVEDGEMSGMRRLSRCSDRRNGKGFLQSRQGRSSGHESVRSDGSRTDQVRECSDSRFPV